jgi:hypothetical protein
MENDPDLLSNTIAKNPPPGKGFTTADAPGRLDIPFGGG